MTEQVKTKGWEVARDLEAKKSTMWERFMPGKRQLIAAA